MNAVLLHIEHPLYFDLQKSPMVKTSRYLFAFRKVACLKHSRYFEFSEKV